MKKDVLINIITQLKQQYDLDNNHIEYIRKKLLAEDINLEELKLRLESLQFDVKEISNVKDITTPAKTYLLYNKVSEDDSGIY